MFARIASSALLMTLFTTLSFAGDVKRPVATHPSRPVLVNDKIIKLPQPSGPDLAAVEIASSVQGGELFGGGPTKIITVGFIRNQGNIDYVGNRVARLQVHTMTPQGWKWVTVAQATIGKLAKGKTFQVSAADLEKNYLFMDGLRVMVSAGDANPSNDVYNFKPVTLPEPK